MKCSCSATSSFQSLNQIKPKEALYRELQVAFCKLFIQCLHNGVCCQNSCKMHHFTPVFLFKENSSSDNGLQVSEDEGAVLSVQEDDPGKEGDADSSGPTDHTTKLLDEAPPKSALKHTLLRRQPSLPRGQCCKETSTKVLFDAPFWWYCVVVRYSQKNRNRSNATLWTPPISNRLLWTPCCFEPKWISWFCQCTFSYWLSVILTSVIGNSPLFRTGLCVVIVCTTSCLRYLDCARSYLLVFLLVILDCFVPVLLVPLMATRNSLRWQGLFI